MNERAKPLRFSRASLDDSRQKSVAAFNELYKLVWYAATPGDEVWSDAGVVPPEIDLCSPQPRSHPLHFRPLPPTSDEWAKPICEALKPLATLTATPSKSHGLIAAEISFVGMDWPGRAALRECHDKLRRALVQTTQSHRFASVSTELDREFIAAAKRVLEGIEVLESHLTTAIPRAAAIAMASDEPSQSDEHVEIPQPKRRGRRKAAETIIERESQLAADWAQARDSGTSKADFTHDRHLTVRKLDALLDRVDKRKKRSDEQRAR